jgi:DNA-directed RNA polymerase specialized sigma24 family protein
VRDITDASDGFDGRAFAALFIGQHAAALRYAQLLAGDAVIAEEAVARAFLALYRRWSDGVVAEPVAYLRRVITDEVASGFRRRSSEHRPVVREPRHGHVLLHAVTRLPPEQQTSIVLRYFAALSGRPATREVAGPVAAS